MKRVGICMSLAALVLMCSCRWDAEALFGGDSANSNYYDGGGSSSVYHPGAVCFGKELLQVDYVSIEACEIPEPLSDYLVSVDDISNTEWSGVKVRLVHHFEGVNPELTPFGLTFKELESGNIQPLDCRKKGVIEGELTYDCRLVGAGLESGTYVMERITLQNSNCFSEATYQAKWGSENCADSDSYPVFYKGWSLPELEVYS